MKKRETRLKTARQKPDLRQEKTETRLKTERQKPE